MRSAARTCESTHLGGRRFVKVLVVAGAMCALTGCDPAGVPEHADGVSLELVVSRDGDANVRLGFGDGPEVDRLLEMANGLDAPVFGNGALRATIDGNGAGSPFLVLRADGVFDPGSDASIRFDLGGLCRQVLDLGYDSSDVVVSEPRVPHDWLIEPSDSWTTSVTLDGCDRAPAGVLELRPRPSRWLIAMGLLAVCIAANVLLFRESHQRPLRRGRATVYGAAGMVVASIGPTASERLRHHGWPVDFEPSHPKMGVLVKELSEQASSIFDRKR